MNIAVFSRIGFLCVLLAACSGNKENTDQHSLFYVRDLLKSHQFDDLDKMLSNHNNDYISGKVSYLNYLWRSETVWAPADLHQSWLPEALEKWLEQRPDSATANIYLGEYYAAKGFDTRGTKWAAQTSRESLQSMEAFFQRSLLYLKKGLSINAEYVSVTPPC